MSRSMLALHAAHVEGYVDPWAVRHVAPAFLGDPDAAFSLCAALSNGKRGHVAVAMWRAKVPREAYGAYIRAAWEHDHQHVIDAAKTRQRLAFMFRYAAFVSPQELPDVLTVWRGTSALLASDAAKGYCWTTDRDTACWFAMRFADARRVPQVLKASVLKSDVALFHDERDEHEVVLLKAPSSTIVDGSAEDWALGFKRKEVLSRAAFPKRKMSP